MTFLAWLDSKVPQWASEALAIGLLISLAIFGTATALAVNY